MKKEQMQQRANKNKEQEKKGAKRESPVYR